MNAERKGGTGGWWRAALGLALLGLEAAAVPTAAPLNPYQGVLRAPTRAALDAAGNLYVTDSRAGRVVKIGTNGLVLASRSGLAKPLGVAVDGQGRVYVGEEGSGRVGVYDGLTLSTNLFSLGVGTNEFQLPNHITVDPNPGGWVYVSDSRTNLIRCYTNATLVKSFGARGAGAGQFDFPAGLCVSPARELYVVDQNNDRVQVFHHTGTFQRAFSLRTPADLVTTTLYGRAQGIASDSAGNAYVTDVFQNEIKVFDAAGAYLTTIGGMGEWIGQQRTPGAAAFGADARLFVANLNNNRIEVFSVSGTTVTLVTLQIVSAYGAPSPAAGTYTNVPGAVLTNAVSLVDTRGTTQYVALGWTLSGNDPLGGTSNTMVMTHTNAAVLTWLWKTQYNLTAVAGPNGAVSPSNSWWDAGSTATVTAVADAYYAFSHWPEFPGPVPLHQQPLIMSQPHSLSAVFVALLATNGVPQWWLASHGLTNGAWDAEALGDQDTDRVSTWEEWAADTIPTNAQSFLGLSALSSTGGGRRVAWHGGVLATQYLERAVAVAGPAVVWETLFTNLPPTAVSTNYLDLTGTSAPAFYRVRVRP